MGGIVSAVIIPCTSRKRRPPPPGLRAIDLPNGDQGSVGAEWLARLRVARAEDNAATLYMGRGFGLGAAAASHLEARLLVVSAGLGLVDVNREVPSYTITVSNRGPDSVRTKTSDRFDPRAWWGTVATGPFSCDLQDAIGERGAVLVALSQPYAELLGDALAGLPAAQRSRLRLFGTGLSRMLPADLADQVMPYDARLDAIIPGTRTDFAQRALSHFANAIGVGGDAAADAVAVERALGRHRAPVRVERPRVDDNGVVLAIRRHLRSATGIGRILRRLRDEDGVACEQRRFTRLYHRAVAQGAAT